MSEEKKYIKDPFVLAEEMEFGDIHFKIDEASGLKAIVAIHDTRLGPSLGGCRFATYTSTNDAVLDAMRLAQGMSFKAAISGLALGGGKAVIIKPDRKIDRKQLFRAFGDFVNGLSGRYITAVDSGTSVSDMDIISTRTTHVRSTSKGINNTGDPSPYTAYGVRCAIEAAVKERTGSKNLSGIHVVIQGVGHVGYYLAKELSALDARLTFCDVNGSAVKKVCEDFSGGVVSSDDVYGVECDVFAPCALGGAINKKTVDQLKTKIVAGAANNQLATDDMANILQQKDILYVPDYVANAGGLIQIALVDEQKVQAKISDIYTTLLSIFLAANQSDKTTAKTADIMAKKIIQQAGIKSARTN